MSQANFIIGRGELLTSDVTVRRGMEPPQPIYSLAKAVEKLEPQIASTSTVIRQLPAAACPADFAVAKLTLHPAYIAKSYYPASLLRAAELVSVGSRNVTITPEKWRKKGEPTPSRTNQLLVAGKRRAFAELAERIRHLTPGGQEALELAQFEAVDPFGSDREVEARLEGQNPALRSGIAPTAGWHLAVRAGELHAIRHRTRRHGST